METLVGQELPQSMRSVWTELALLQLQTGNTAMYAFTLAVVLVFLVLAAQYESWSLPLAVILVVPMCLLCSTVGVNAAQMDINIFTQVGFIVLVGLACKNAILIVEFAKKRREFGASRQEATLDACELRLRPIMMTSFAFILGVVPLIISAGAGSEMRQTLGMAVFSGMLGVTLFGIFLTPVFYFVIQWASDRRNESCARATENEEEPEESQNGPPHDGESSNGHPRRGHQTHAFDGEGNGASVVHHPAHRDGDEDFLVAEAETHEATAPWDMSKPTGPFSSPFSPSFPTFQVSRKQAAMNRLAVSVLLALVAAGSVKALEVEPIAASGIETKYVSFQLMTGLPGYAGPQPMPGRFSLSKAQLEAFVREVVKAIGTTGDARHKLGFAVGPLCFDMSDEETRQFIRDAFAVARENDVAVAFHIDDSMCWGRTQGPVVQSRQHRDRGLEAEAEHGPARRLGSQAHQVSAPDVFQQPRHRGRGERPRGADRRGDQAGAGGVEIPGKEHLFAGVIAGWETQIGRDFETGRPLGYRALRHRGFSESNPPKDPDLERVTSSRSSWNCGPIRFTPAAFPVSKSSATSRSPTRDCARRTRRNPMP